jgi:ketosteroid isomerase-like protein
MTGEDLMRTVTGAFAVGDLGPLMSALHPDVVWKSASRQPGGPFSFKGDYRNRAGVVEVLSNIAKDYTFHHMTPKEITGGKDVVWGLFDAGVCYDAKGKGAETQLIQIDIAIRWRLQDGKIIEHQAFLDTAYLAMRPGILPPAETAAAR